VFDVWLTTFTAKAMHITKYHKENEELHQVKFPNNSVVLKHLNISLSTVRSGKILEGTQCVQQ
jgi:hypothetical protein